MAYLKHAQVYYKDSQEFNDIKPVVRRMRDLFGQSPAALFGTKEFLEVRDSWIADGTKTRQTVNKMTGRMKRIVKWCCGQGLIPAGNWVAIQCIETLKKGRTELREAEPIEPVDPQVVEQTLPEMTAVLAAMVRFQQFTGCRPGEVCKIKPGMIDMSGDVWTIDLREHKTAHRDLERTIYVGPKAQGVIMPFLSRPADSFCFSPAESEKQRLEAKHEARATPLNQGNRPGLRKTRKPRRPPGDRYTSGSYGRAVKYACYRAFPFPQRAPGEPEPTEAEIKQWRQEHCWHPNQLRHLTATELRKKFDLEASQVILGHQNLQTTQIYAEKNRLRAIEIAREIG